MLPIELGFMGCFGIFLLKKILLKVIFPSELFKGKIPGEQYDIADHVLRQELIDISLRCML